MASSLSPIARRFVLTPWKGLKGKKENGNKEIVLNWITPHQKWGIHSTYSDNLLMLTLSRGGPDYLA